MRFLLLAEFDTFSLHQITQQMKKAPIKEDAFSLAAVKKYVFVYLF